MKGGSTVLHHQRTVRMMFLNCIVIQFAPVPVRAHAPPKMCELKLLKDSKVKDPDVVENPTVSGLGYKVRQSDMDNRDPAISSSPPPPIHVDSSSSGGNGVMTDAQGNNTYDTQWPNVHAPVFTTDNGLGMQPSPGFQNALPITHNTPFMYPLAITPFNGDCLKYCKLIKNLDKYVASSASDDGYRLLQLESLCSGEAKEVVSGLGRIYDKSQAYRTARARQNLRFGDRRRLMNAVRKDLLEGEKISKWDDKALSSLSNKMFCCEATFRSWEKLFELDSPDVI